MCVYLLPGSVPSLAAGLLFGGLAGLGSYQLSQDPKNVWLFLGTSFHGLSLMHPWVGGTWQALQTEMLLLLLSSPGEGLKGGGLCPLLLIFYVEDAERFSSLPNVG